MQRRHTYAEALDFMAIQQRKLSKLYEAHGECDRFEFCLFYERQQVFMAKIFEKKTNKQKNLDTEEVTAMYHDFQKSICSFVT